MTRVDAIKSEIEKLSLSERAELAKWLHGWADDAWDHQMSDDLQAGKLDTLLDQVRDDTRLPGGAR